jgi:hypothetical protein
VKRSQDSLGLGVVAEGLADVRKKIYVPWTENETATELEWIRAQALLAVAGRPGASPCLRIVRA